MSPSRLAKVRGLAGDLAHRRRVAYVGWLNHGNLGDDAMYEALGAALRPFHLMEVPPKLIGALARGPSRGLLDGIMIGGGTLIGQERHREALERLMSAQPSALPFMLGSGVDDPYADTARGAAAHEELRRWTGPLSGFERVTVRGPRSQQLLAEIGVHADVVGDPALLLAPRDRPAAATEQLLGINVSLSAPVRGGDAGGTLEAVRGAMRTMVERGWRVRLVSMWPGDEPALDSLLADAPAGTEVVKEYVDIGRVLEALGGCRVFMGLKLHSVVLASAMGVPSLMLAYHPKCDDFQASIGLDHWSLTTDGLDASTVTERLEALVTDHAATRAQLVERIDSLRDGLHREAERIIARLGRPART